MSKIILGISKLALKVASLIGVKISVEIDIGLQDKKADKNCWED